jgi:NAD(P)-dependent dehydrogenase (short-subunit alcohol dehydrogenase family)
MLRPIKRAEQLRSRCLPMDGVRRSCWARGTPTRRRLRSHDHRDNVDPAFPYHAFYGPVYPASKTALNAITLAMIIELESTGIKVNLVSPGFTKTNLNGYEGMESVEQGSREVVRVALLGPDGPSGTFTRSENATIPWRSGKAETHRSAHRQLRRHICAAAQPPKAPRRDWRLGPKTLETCRASSAPDTVCC